VFILISYLLYKKFGFKKITNGIIFLLAGVILILFSGLFQEWTDKLSTFYISLFSGIFLTIISGVLIAFGLSKKKKNEK
jgi:drug/metabolite transporter (DMT)-like permease